MKQASRHPSNRRRAALYARVSTEEQAMHGVSLDAQRERLLRYAEENGLCVVDVYVDEGISARKRYTARPAFMRMLEDVRAARIDLILFIKLDRWFRSIADYYEVQAILDRHRVQWIATEEEYDTTTANGRLALNIKLAIAQDESDRTSERIKFVFSNMIREGRVISGKTPLGYRIENKRAVIDEEKAPLVRALFASYLQTRSQRAAARELLSRFGFRADPHAIHHMLTNRWYIGEAYGIPDWCPVIVDRETFSLAQSLLCGRGERNATEHPERVYLFTGLLRCQVCGRRLSTYSCQSKSSGDSLPRRFVYYRCSAHGLGTCTMRQQINEQTLEACLLDKLDALASHYDLSVFHQPKAVARETNDTARILGKIEKLKDLYLNDLLPRSVYEKEYASLTHALRLAETPLPPSKAQAAPDSFPNRFADAYHRLSSERKKAFWTRALASIAVGQNGELAVSFRQSS